MNANQLELAKNKAQNLKVEALVTEGNLSKNHQLKIDFFDEADKKARLNRARRTVEEIMNQRAFLLNERRARLKQLLTSEDKQYEQEILSTTVSPLERAAELREKAKIIRANKLAEDTKFVQEKLDQKWRLECDELRTYQSKKLQSGMGVEHVRQIEEKIDRERERLEDEGIFAEMWYQDIEAKNFKEDEKVRRAKERNMQVSAVLKQQMEVLEAQKMEAKRIRNENAKLLKEKSHIEKLEQQLEFQKKRQDQAQRRHELDLCVRAKLMNEKRRMQEENAFDLQCLEESIVSFQNEDEERSQRKQEMMVEQQHYRRYLEALREEERRQERELEQFVERDTEAQMQKQLAKWKAQKMERKRMLEETLRGRKHQIEERSKWLNCCGGRNSRRLKKAVLKHP